MTEYVDIIISRYNEDLEWLNEYPFSQFSYIVYNKGNNNNFCKKNVKNVVQLENVGKNDHTYLYHIVENYSKLNNILVFFPGSLNLNYKKDKAKIILINIINNNYKNAFFVGHYQKSILNSFYDFKLDNWETSDKQNLMLNNEKALQLCSIRPYNQWYKYFFGNQPAHWSTWWGIFSVDKRDIIRHPQQRYAILMNILSKHSNPEAGHYIERSWGAIFYPLIFTKKITE